MKILSVHRIIVEVKMFLWFFFLKNYTAYVDIFNFGYRLHRLAFKDTIFIYLKLFKDKKDYFLCFNLINLP